MLSNMNDNLSKTKITKKVECAEWLYDVLFFSTLIDISSKKKLQIIIYASITMDYPLILTSFAISLRRCNPVLAIISWLTFFLSNCTHENRKISGGSYAWEYGADTSGYVNRYCYRKDGSISSGYIPILMCSFSFWLVFLEQCQNTHM